MVFWCNILTTFWLNITLFLQVDYCDYADVDECATNNGACSIEAICTNSMGSRKCTCKPGYTGDGQSCTSTGN